MSTTIFNPSDYKPRKNDYEDNLRNELDYMKNYNGLYPNKVKLLGNNLLTKRLKNLIKDRYSFLVKTWAVETPIEIKNSMFSAWGCQQHNCSNTNFIIVVDFKKNVVYVGIREEENVKIYSEDGSSNILVNNWAKRIS
ncbi:hypothetical protein [Pedobacter sp. Leaf132]|uniref:hypothetical protein n=1 Tax=Pedobacter sp. Leaf132 TaxID=2876557 RepID=UPI001E4D568C|nr:hypothetical protein [Pedobacter sp. Leaf132]